MAPQSRLESMLIRHEGLRLKPYRCPAGKLTIGVGHNLDDRGISHDIAMALLAEDIRVATRDVDVWLGPVSSSADLAGPRSAVLIDMAFNLGRERLMAFKRLRAAILKSDWSAAAREMTESRWAQQVGDRASELATMMLTNQWCPGDVPNDQA